MANSPRYEPDDRGLLPAQYASPTGSWEAKVIQQATAVITLPRQQVQMAVAPMLPSVLPPGVDPVHVTPDARAVLNAPGMFPDLRGWVSGNNQGYSLPRDVQGTPS